MINGVNFSNRDNCTQRKLIVLNHTISSEVILGIKFTKNYNVKCLCILLTNMSINTIIMKSISIKDKKYS